MEEKVWQRQHFHTPKGYEWASLLSVQLHRAEERMCKGPEAEVCLMWVAFMSSVAL